MFRTIVEAVWFHRGARETVANLRASVREVEAETQAFISKLSVEREEHRATKADLRAMTGRMQTAEERAFWLEAENRDLRRECGRPAKTNPNG